MELLYPFPETELIELIESYPNLERVVWVQEEPRNMGARAYMRRRMAGILPERLSYDYVGRQLRAAPGEGYSAAHKREQARIVRVALDLEHDKLEPDSSAQRPIDVAEALALVALRVGHRGRDADRPEPPLQPRRGLGREPTTTSTPARRLSGATSISPRPSSIPRTTAAATCSALISDTHARQLRRPSPRTSRRRR